MFLNFKDVNFTHDKSAQRKRGLLVGAESPIAYPKSALSVRMKPLGRRRHR